MERDGTGSVSMPGCERRTHTAGGRTVTVVDATVVDATTDEMDVPSRRLYI